MNCQFNGCQSSSVAVAHFHLARETRQLCESHASYVTARAATVSCEAIVCAYCGRQAARWDWRLANGSLIHPDCWNEQSA